MPSSACIDDEGPFGPGGSGFPYFHLRRENVIIKPEMPSPSASPIISQPDYKNVGREI